MLRQAVRFDVATAAIKGGRDYQEDSLVASFPQGQETGFTIVADGMGGHLSGDVASAIVMSEVFSQIKRKEMLLNTKYTDISAFLYNAAMVANTGVTQHIAERPDSYGMGATLLACIIRDDDLYWVSVGDSPLFLFRDGALRQLNQDHSLAPQIDMMVKVGAMDPEVGRNHPDRNTLTSAIAGADVAKIDCPETPMSVLECDIVIAASDGLQFLSNDMITAILQQTQNASSSEITEALLSAIADLDDPDQDNTAFTVIKLGARRNVALPTPVDAAPVLVELPTDSEFNLSTDAELPAARVEEQIAEAVNTPEPIDIPTKRIIRLVTSQALSFDQPALKDEQDVPTVKKVQSQNK
ncbi:PP2C family protein-serine/threonine phosphatase [Yoonia maricola]|uniref:PP2C family protein-serine/threonine phosphatase n=1 Tax=Yoonia maricola TaxID=420999 RepID=UPI001FEBB80A|nr:protein phosphatase 2C domain-containing protein [Yoonia maricola]